MTVGIPNSLKKYSKSSLKHHSRPSDQLRVPKASIIPRISVDNLNVEWNNAGRATTEIELRVRPEDDDDKNQHYFSDQFVRRRPKWHKSWIGAIAMAVFAVDISSVTSFPEKVATNGGFAFIIAYLIAKFAVVLPYLYLEGIIGQYFQISFFGVWGICPIFKGITVGVFLTCFSISTIYPTFITWAFFMMVEAAKSIGTGQVAWDDCLHEWNTCHCRPYPINKECVETSDNQTVNSAQLEYFVGTIIRMWKTKYADPTIIKDATENGKLSTSFGFHSEEGLGEFNYGLAVFLGVICIILLFVTWSSRKTAGLIYTFSAFFPLVVLTLMICRGLTVEGATDGLAKYFSPDFGQLLRFQLWITATQTAFFSVGAGFGVHLTTASFNHLHHNVFNDAVGCMIIDTMTSLMSCVVNFSFLGHYHWVKNEDVPDEYAGGGKTVLFSFTIFLEALSNFSATGFFSTLYYLMIIVFTLDTCAITLQTIVNSFHEEYIRKYPDQDVSELIFLFGFVGFNFLLSLLLMTRGGIWAVLFVVQYGYGFSFCTYPALQAIAFSWIWGLENVCNAAHTINGKRPSLYLRICWKYVCPLVLLIFLGKYALALSWKPLTIFGITAPDSTIPFAISLSFFSITMYIICTLIDVIKWTRKAKGLTYLMLLLSPEYEHEEIKQNVRNAKRLHWKHYCFLLFPDETIMKVVTSDFRNIFKKRNRVSIKEPEENQQNRPRPSHMHHHHHRLTQESIDKSPSAWSLYEEDRVRHSTASSIEVTKPHEQVVITVNDKDNAPGKPKLSKSKKRNTKEQDLTDEPPSSTKVIDEKEVAKKKKS